MERTMWLHFDKGGEKKKFLTLPCNFSPLILENAFLMRSGNHNSVNFISVLIRPGSTCYQSNIVSTNKKKVSEGFARPSLAILRWCISEDWMADSRLFSFDSHVCLVRLWFNKVHIRSTDSPSFERHMAEADFPLWLFSVKNDLWSVKVSWKLYINKLIQNAALTLWSWEFSSMHNICPKAPQKCKNACIH